MNDDNGRWVKVVGMMNKYTNELWIGFGGAGKGSRFSITHGLFFVALVELAHLFFTNYFWWL
jgi:hypothetical protein